MKVQDADGRRYLKWTLEKFMVRCHAWIHLAQDMIEWRFLVTTVPPVPEN
jgi:hypothetical protein